MSPKQDGTFHYVREGLPSLMMSLCWAYTDDSQSSTLFLAVGRGRERNAKKWSFKGSIWSGLISVPASLWLHGWPTQLQELRWNIFLDQLELHVNVKPTSKAKDCLDFFLGAISFLPLCFSSISHPFILRKNASYEIILSIWGYFPEYQVIINLIWCFYVLANLGHFFTTGYLMEVVGAGFGFR